MNVSNTRAIILAAGRSTRFKTDRSKLVYTVCGQPMILYPINTIISMDIPITVVLGYNAEKIKESIENSKIKVDFVIQKESLGTGDAVAVSKETWDKKNILILNGDTPFLTVEIVKDLIDFHSKKRADLTFLSAHCLNPAGYGRVIKNKNKFIVVEEKNCTEKQKHISLINAGIYIVSKKFLEENIDKIEKNSVTGEYYITELINIASEQDLNIQTIQVPYDNVRGVNTLEELWAAEQIKRSELIKMWMSRGVRFELAQSIHLDYDIEIGKESFIGTGVHLLKGAKIGKNCVINAFTIIENTQIDDNTHIHSHSVIQDSKIGSFVHVGPFARLRNNVVLGNNVNIGNFVELKNSKISDNTKAKHLTFIGDAIVGKSVNIGAGTITCNYDGTNKYQTTIEDNVFIGSNNTIVAPLKVGQNSYTAGGSTITKDVPAKSLAIARAKQENKENYADKLRKPKTSDDHCPQCQENQENNKSDLNKSKTKLNFIGAVKVEDLQNNL